MKIRRLLELPVLTSCALMAISCHPAAAEVAENQAVSTIALSRGYSARIDGRKLIVTGPSKTSAAVAIEIPPCPIVDATDIIRSSDLKDSLAIWRETIRKSSIVSDGKYVVGKLMVPDTVRAITVDIDTLRKDPFFANDVPLSATKEEYKAPQPRSLVDIDRSFAEGLKLPYDELLQRPGSAVTYKMRTRRLDSIVLSKNGKFNLVAGVPDFLGLEPAKVSADDQVLVNICAPVESQPLTAQNVLPVKESGNISDARFAKNQQALKSTMEKLKAGQPIKVVFWGDSVTSGGFAMKPADFFASRVLAGLHDAFPKSQVAYLNLGVAGSNTSWRLPSFQKDVLSQHPDVVIVEFVNDFSLPLKTLIENFNVIIAQSKAAGAELILCTPHSPLPSSLGFATWHDVATSEYPTLLRQLADAHGLALCDVVARWDHLMPQGYLPKILLKDGLVHPNDYGHRIYAEELLACFRQSKVDKPTATERTPVLTKQAAPTVKH